MTPARSCAMTAVPVVAAAVEMPAHAVSWPSICSITNAPTGLPAAGDLAQRAVLVALDQRVERALVSVCRQLRGQLAHGRVEVVYREVDVGDEAEVGVVQLRVLSRGRDRAGLLVLRLRL